MRENWRDIAKIYEQDFMHLKDQYSELARVILGDRKYGQSFWGDPIMTHPTVLEVAVTIAEAYYGKSSKAGEGATGPSGDGIAVSGYIHLGNPKDR